MYMTIMYVALDLVISSRWLEPERGSALIASALDTFYTDTPFAGWKSLGGSAQCAGRSILQIGSAP